MRAAWNENECGDDIDPHPGPGVPPAACDHDWRDIDGRWLCIECRAEKPYASDAAYEREESCGDTQPHEAHLHSSGEYVYLCPGDSGPPSSSGRTPGFDPGDAGSTPAGGASAANVHPPEPDSGWERAAAWGQR